MYWKINNISKTAVKVSLQKSALVTVGVILQPGEFCIATNQLTTSMDAQERRKFISIDRKYSNEYNLDLGVSYSESTLSIAIQKAQQYTASTSETQEEPQTEPVE